eukprot:4915010-Prorocentrum_lima.AAC.1
MSGLSACPEFTEFPCSLSCHSVGSSISFSSSLESSRLLLVHQVVLGVSCLSSSCCCAAGGCPSRSCFMQVVK